MPSVAKIAKLVIAFNFALVGFYLLANTPINIFPEGLLERVEQQFGEDAKERVEEWQTLVDDAQQDSEKEKLTRVNRFFNEVRFVADERVWGQKDYWATPLEFLGKNAGDCEDFTIAKYFTLRALALKKINLG